MYMVGCLEEYDQVSELYETSEPPAPTKSIVESNERHLFRSSILKIQGDIWKHEERKIH